MDSLPGHYITSTGYVVSKYFKQFPGNIFIDTHPSFYRGCIIANWLFIFIGLTFVNILLTGTFIKKILNVLLLSYMQQKCLASIEYLNFFLNYQKLHHQVGRWWPAGSHDASLHRPMQMPDLYRGTLSKWILCRNTNAMWSMFTSQRLTTSPPSASVTHLGDRSLHSPSLAISATFHSQRDTSSDLI